MIAYPLTRANRIRLARAFYLVPRVDIAIDCVLEDQMGAAFVDDLEEPSVFQISMVVFHYLAGNPQHPFARDAVMQFPPYHLLMAAAPGFLRLFREVFGPRLVPLTRYRFSAENLSINFLKGLLDRSPVKGYIEPFDRPLVERLYADAESYIDISPYDSPEDFLQRGMGYACYEGREIIGAAYASLVNCSSIEISLYVEPYYRRRGVATALSAALILWALENRLTPHWDAANPESRALAEKLGFVPRGVYQAYYVVEPSAAEPPQ